ncbi:hypothetical protein D3Z51_18860 [Clostridiaceae bacterium]|nr:hypothetical protein [Clostridiaceae bacterium]RKI08719.1 hypothetical protein D7V81_18595 [bacterium 1XD21-70]
MLLGFTAYVLIPIYTILFVQGSNWLTTNFSVIGNKIGREEEFVLWGLIVGIYFFGSLRLIITRMPAMPGHTWLIPLALVLLACAVTTPYLPEKLPLKSRLHIAFAFLAAVCLILCLARIVWVLYQDNRKKYRPYLLGLVGILSFSVFLFFIAGIISSALEIFFTIALTLMVHRLYLALQ